MDNNKNIKFVNDIVPYEEVKVINPIFGLNKGDILYYNYDSNLYEFKLKEENLSKNKIETKDRILKLHPDTITESGIYNKYFEYNYDSNILNKECHLHNIFSENNSDNKSYDVDDKINNSHAELKKEPDNKIHEKCFLRANSLLDILKNRLDYLMLSLEVDEYYPNIKHEILNLKNQIYSLEYILGHRDRYKDYSLFS